jgi:ATP-dependent exoDNAse (exonuclease V) beta subunit
LEALDTTFVVEAAAGTGKTTVLLDRVVMLVRRGRARLDQVICVTFTERAAGEMKLRLRARLERAQEASVDAQEKERLTDAIEALEVARIGTIHGLCADLLREYPVEAHVDPLFEVAAEGDAEALQVAAFHRTFQTLLETQPEGVRRALRRKQRGANAVPPRRVLLRAAQALIEHRDFDGPWVRVPFERTALLDSTLAPLRVFAAEAPFVRRKPNRDSPFFELLERVRRFVEELDHRESVSPRDPDGLEAQLVDLASSGFLWESRPWGLDFSGGRTESSLLERRDIAWEHLKAVVRQCDADLAAALREELRPVVDAYEREKAQMGVLDFVDLLLLTRNLLGTHASVRQSLQQRFTHVFVDEFQDTDPLQSEIVLLLASQDPSVSDPFETQPTPGKLFVVGDPKQSIYRFRRADILLYEHVKQHLLKHGATLVDLSTSFRATPGIQAAVNGAFSLVMTGGHQARYVPLRKAREGLKDQPSLVALPAANPFGNRGKPTKEAVEASVADVVAGFIEWLVSHSGWKVEEDGLWVPVQPRHICILFKRLRGWSGVDVPRPYAQALEARSIGHVLVGGRSFHTREEVMALRVALTAIDRPDDELSVYATLRGPFCAITDEVLFAFRNDVGKLHPLAPVASEVAQHPEFGAVVEALVLLKELHLERNRRPVAATVNAFLEETRAHAGVAFWKAGAQALANILQLAEVTRRSERRATSFREVVETLQAQADEGEAPEAPLVEEGTDGVRMMTVHAAKGLEFPVVILAEPTAKATRMDPQHWVDPQRRVWVYPLAHCIPHELRERQVEALARDHEEAIRLAYVAATRARDVLVVPLSSEKQWPDAWTEVLRPSLFPLVERAHEPTPAPGCPPFGNDVILHRDGPLPPHVPRPGLHLASTQKNRVVWFDPNVLSLGKEGVSGIEADEALRDDDSQGVLSLEAYQQWRQERSEATAAGAALGTRVVVAREMPADEVGAVLPIPVEMTAEPRARRPGGRRFGELVHASLAVVPLNADRATVERTVAVMTRALRASEAETTAAVAAVLSALEHPLFTEARAAKRVCREASVVDHLPDGSVMEGVVDLAFETDEGWRVVEFKTDDVIEDRLAQYEAQTRAYVRAISAATGAAASGVILRV